jgi:hypothetical protein
MNVKDINGKSPDDLSETPGNYQTGKQQKENFRR